MCSNNLTASSAWWPVLTPFKNTSSKSPSQNIGRGLSRSAALFCNWMQKKHSDDEFVKPLELFGWQLEHKSHIDWTLLSSALQFWLCGCCWWQWYWCRWCQSRKVCPSCVWSSRNRFVNQENSHMGAVGIPYVHGIGKKVNGYLEQEMAQTHKKCIE